ncbi:unnamed protein product [Cyprideis torosa]|uniref:5-demethoxyubiquinone hydroxylase, mitochondrial n=1 Tax=Cyprideis torosa TaxID=163714 RepID=A0A7R9A0R7_9CRUS|nr:unnamed protein product [Cyprideis torosa]CAG0911078.1 unnamed protein product [Cyprideis torosa]
MRHLSSFDIFLSGLEGLLTGTTTNTQGSDRQVPYPQDFTDALLSPQEASESVALMRVNHAGEIAAQALYQGQILTARSQQTRDSLKQSAIEEQDHLIWCKNRVEELGGTTSHLEPIWHWGSYCIGALAGAAGDRWSLGFIKETEDQVIDHLKGHLQALPSADHKSRAIIGQMIIDEAEHGDKAVAAGGAPLPLPVKQLMRATAKIMTGLSRRF